jgi:hypothetical protein
MQFEKTRIASVNYILNTALCQFTPGASKTTKAIDYIKHFSILSRFLRGEVENGIHHVTIILSNNNLIETKMWRHRLADKTERLNICTLSSKEDSTYKSIAEVINALVRAKNPNQLPDILLMCTHGARTDNITELIDTLEFGNLSFGNMGIRQITMTIMFDEADKNIALIADFIKKFSDILMKGEKNTTVRDVHFITATPGPEFWKHLEKCGIKNLKNIQHALQDNPDVVRLTHEELLKDYRKIDDHKIHSEVDNMDEDPVYYASLVLQKILERRAANNEVLTVFAPAELYLTTHYKMASLFKVNKFVCLILNGEKKGFLYPNETFVSLEEFNQQHGVKGELYNTLVKWRSLNPTLDLAITGYLNVERGVTFCTKGFNFTDLIISAYHLRNWATLIQLLGRANGGKEYVQIMNIWSPKKVIEKANEQIKIMNELHTRDPEVYVETDFRKKTKREVLDVAMTVPVVIAITPAEFASIKKVGRSYDKAIILGLIRSRNPELASNIASMEKKQITLPEEPASIKKHITDFLSAAERNIKMSIDITKKEREAQIDLYQIFIDKTETAPKLIVSIFRGSLLKQPVDE